ncbi:hypothetical protein ACFXJ5_33390 [Streptomyces sp. NPDC059373]
MLSSRMTRARKRNGLRTALLSGFVALFALATTSSFGSATATAEPASNAHKYYGYWNYDQPNVTTLNNVAVLACPDGTSQCDSPLPLPLRIPQVGWVLFSAGPNGTVNGHTDQGCTWNFTVTPTGLELSSTTQQCFNHNIGSAGNITKWSVQVDGNREQEQIVAISHQPNGTDLTATMNSGSRTRVDGEGGTRHIHRFLGSYSYDPADYSTLTNVVSTDKGTLYPEQGTVQFTSKGKGIINAHTPNGCDWTLAVHGDTAELDPATQTCHTPSGDSSLRYWALVTDDGKHLNGFLAGSTTTHGQTPTNTYLFIGALTRSAT